MSEEIYIPDETTELVKRLIEEGGTYLVKDGYILWLSLTFPHEMCKEGMKKILNSPRHEYQDRICVKACLSLLTLGEEALTLEEYKEYHRDTRESIPYDITEEYVVCEPFFSLGDLVILLRSIQNLYRILEKQNNFSLE